MQANTSTSVGVGHVPSDCDVVFVSDMFLEDGYVGGAELTTDALIRSMSCRVFKLRSRDVGIVSLSTGLSKKWIFGNISQIPGNMLVQVIVFASQRLEYATIEYDCKYCTHRSTLMHAHVLGHSCDCANGPLGRLMSEYYAGARVSFWMSHKQLEDAKSFLPALDSTNNVVLSSVFDEPTLTALELFRRERDIRSTNGKWAVLSGGSWVKGCDAALVECEKRGLTPHALGGIPYAQMIEELSKCDGLVYTPAGADTCPRLTIEAKLMGLQLILNDNVQHKDEEWFSGSIDDCRTYMALTAHTFNCVLSENFSFDRTLSGYTTTRNCVSQGYPFERSINSMLQFCDEVCILDSGSTDGTWERLVLLAYPDATEKLLSDELVDLAEQLKSGPEFISSRAQYLLSKLNSTKIKIKQIAYDWNVLNFALLDGKTKAVARSMCTSTFCWQQDSDEIVLSRDAQQIRNIVCGLPMRGDYVLCLPVVEFWGQTGKVRIDVTPWKWRLSPNSRNITHGVPAHLRWTDNDGYERAKPGTDGCDMITVDAGGPLAAMSYYTPEMENMRQGAIRGNVFALNAWRDMIAKTTSNLPCVYHYSWVDIARKMRTYRDYWTKHWNALYGTDTRDTAATNMFFNKPWSEVSEREICEKAAQLEAGTTGWIFHQKWNGEAVPGIDGKLLWQEIESQK